MDPRHAAILALLGWLIIMPTNGSDVHIYKGPQEWPGGWGPFIGGKFPNIWATKADCEAELAYVRSLSEGGRELVDAVCARNDDPLLHLKKPFDYPSPED